MNHPFRLAVVAGVILLAARLTAQSLVINEFMAVNDSGIRDEDSDRSDWLELYNAGTASVNLAGWRVTDNAAAPSKWIFPATNLPPGGFVLVFASDKNRAVAGQELHANFKLSSSGEYLGLITPDGSIAHEYAPTFPPQLSDISYGIPAAYASVTLIETGVPCRALVPRNDALGLTWTSNSFDDSTWLGGLTGVGFERSTGYEPYIGLDVNGPMYASNATCYVRVPFVSPAPGSAYHSLTLAMTFDDGYVTYLNGRRGPGANEPYVLAWNTNATTYSSEPEVISSDLSDLRGVLAAGANVLAVHGLNQTRTSSDFLILPRLTGTLTSMSITNAPGPLAAPTPNSPNSGLYVPTVAAVQFGQPRGYYEAPFALTLSCATVGAELRYTTDFTVPTPTSGVLYTAPIPVNRTTCLRASAFKAAHHPAPVATRTFIFIEQVVTQANDQRAYGFPTNWVTKDGVNIAADYAMDQRIVGTNDNYGGVYRASIRGDLRSIPVMSLVATITDLFDRATGIYANPQQLGGNWERPVSVEYFNRSDNPDGFQIDCGLRIHGDINRSPNNKKHSFRLAFRSMYGASKLRYPFFEGDPVEEYDTLVLRCMYGDSWMANNRASYLREQYAFDTQLDAGYIGTRGNFVHLYVNGLYWGLYMAAERPDETFNADHVGGVKENWDILAGNIITEVELNEGQRAAYDAMMALVPKEPTTTISDVNYALLEQYLDMPLYCDYMIWQFYAQNWDWPRKNWQLACERNPDNPAGPPLRQFVFRVWDNESTLPWYTQDRTSIGNDLAERVGPAQIYKKIRGHRTFRRVFGDRVHRLFYNGGAYTTASNLVRWTRSMEHIKRAVVGESARWGDFRVPNSPYTRDPFPFNGTSNWYSEMEIETNTWFPFRNAVVLNQFRAAGLYPSVSAPTFSQFGGAISSGFALAMTAPAGTIYYTRNGSDPANNDDSVSTSAFAYSAPVPLAQNTRVRARARSGSVWSAMTEAVFIAGPPPLRISEIMYHPLAPPPGSPYGKEDFEFIELCNISGEPQSLAGLEFQNGIRFHFSNAPIACAPLQTVVLVRHPEAFASRYDTNGMRIASAYDGFLANEGERILLHDELFGALLDFSYTDTWYPSTDGGGYSLTIIDPFDARENWGSSNAWRPSERLNGTPGETIPEPACAALLALALLAVRREHHRAGHTSSMTARVAP